jgi:hypothetical protein
LSPSTILVAWNPGENVWACSTVQAKNKNNTIAVSFFWVKEWLMQISI